MPSPVPKTRIHHHLLPLLVLILFAAALWILHGALRQFHYQQVVTQLKAIPTMQVLSALGLTILSYLALTVYDRLAILYIRHPLETGKVSLASFVSYAFSNTIGLSLLTAGTIRYRLYSAWGLSTEEIARLVTFTVLTFWLGIITVSGLVFISEPHALPALEHLPFHSVRVLGLFMVGLVCAYPLVIVLRKKPLRFRSWELPLPSLRLAGAQLGWAQSIGF